MRILISVLFLFCLLRITISDIKERKVPDRYVLLLALLAVVRIAAVQGTGIGERIAGALCISAPLFLLAVLTKGGFGGGDIKLMAAGGLFLGWRLTVSAAVIALFLCGAYIIGMWVLQTIWQKSRKREWIHRCRISRKTELPFAPFLCAGMALGVLGCDVFSCVL